jgi:CheY-like chemotaxis protein
VLIVDDDETILSLIEYLLTDMGYRVHLAADGREALKRVTDERPDLILLDLMMPVLNGWEVMRRLREDSATEDIPVIVVSADHSVATKARELGAQDYIAKPFDVEEIIAKVDRLLL